MHSAKTRVVPPAGCGVSGPAVQDICAAHSTSTVVDNFVNRLQVMRSAKSTPVVLYMGYVGGQHDQHQGNQLLTSVRSVSR